MGQKNRWPAQKRRDRGLGLRRGGVPQNTVGSAAVGWNGVSGGMRCGIGCGVRCESLLTLHETRNRPTVEGQRVNKVVEAKEGAAQASAIYNSLPSDSCWARERVRFEGEQSNLDVFKVRTGTFLT